MNIKEYISKVPTFFIDEKPFHLLEDLRAVIKTEKSVKIQKQDSEYKRKGIANIFCIVEPLANKYITEIIEKKRRIEFTQNIKIISEAYPDIDYINIIKNSKFLTFSSFNVNLRNLPRFIFLNSLYII